MIYMMQVLANVKATIFANVALLRKDQIAKLVVIFVVATLLPCLWLIINVAVNG